jgi:hypothetical protein
VTFTEQGTTGDMIRDEIGTYDEEGILRWQAV